MAGEELKARGNLFPSPRYDHTSLKRGDSVFGCTSGFALLEVSTIFGGARDCEEVFKIGYLGRCKARFGLIGIVHHTFS